MRSTSELPLWDDAWVLARRPPRNAVDPYVAHASFVEPERTRFGTVEDVLTILLTNRECPFRCVMCDLWKNTTETRVPVGAIPAQIARALREVRAADSPDSEDSIRGYRFPTPPGFSGGVWSPEDGRTVALDGVFGIRGERAEHIVNHVKLYNAGNFFDAQAIPPADLPRIAEQMAGFRSVIIECHPLLVGARCEAFAQRLSGELHVAMGLETVHPDVLPRLNKRMTLADYERATRFLVERGMSVRAFILLKPPLLDEAEGLDWARRSIDWAQDIGVECCVVIPTRAGNGAMEELQSQGLFSPPLLSSLEHAAEHGIGRGRGRVFVDLWNIEQLFGCAACGPARAARLKQMNLTQTIPPRVECECRP